MATCVLVAIVKKRMNFDLSLLAMLQILSVTPFEKTPLIHLFTDTVPLDILSDNPNQLNLL